MLAHSFFHGVGVGEGGGSHIGKGLSWYVGPVLHDLLRRESDLWVVRAEACEFDLEGSIRWLRGDDTLDVLRTVWKSSGFGLISLRIIYNPQTFNVYFFCIIMRCQH